MKRSAWIKASGLLALASLFAFTTSLLSCGKKNSNYDLNTNVNVADDIVFVQRGLLNTFGILLKANSDSMIMAGISGIIDNALVTYIRSQNKFLISYKNKTCADSVVRNGLVTVFMTGDFFTAGSAARLVYTSYTEDSRMYTGHDSLSNTGPSTGGGLRFIAFTDSLVIAKDSNHKTLWYSALEFLLPVQNKGLSSVTGPVLVNGSGHGTSSGSNTFSFQVSESLSDDLFCGWIRSGEVSLQVPLADIPTGTIRYMNADSCNNRVFYDFEGHQFQWWINKKKLGF